MILIGCSVCRKKDFSPGQSQLSPGSPSGAAATRFLGHSPWQVKRYLHCRQNCGSVSGLGPAELHLFFRADEITDRRLHDVSQQMFRLYEVVARVNVAVMFEGDTVAARRAQDTKGRLAAEIRGQYAVEEQYEHGTDVPDDPLVENVHQKTAILLPAGRIDP